MARRIAESAATSMDEVVVATLELGSDRGALQAAMTTICDRVPRSAVMLLSPDPEAGKVSVMAAVPRGLIGRGLKAGDWVREVTALMGGKGGGKPEQAQGAGSDLGKLKQAGAEARKIAYRLLG